MATIGDPPRSVEDADLRGTNFGTLPDCFYREFTVYDKVGMWVTGQKLVPIRWGLSLVTVSFGLDITLHVIVFNLVQHI